MVRKIHLKIKALEIKMESKILSNNKKIKGLIKRDKSAFMLLKRSQNKKRKK